MTDKKIGIPFEFSLLFLGILLILISYNFIIYIFYLKDTGYYTNLFIGIVTASFAFILAVGIILAFYGFFKILLKMGKPKSEVD